MSTERERRLEVRDEGVYDLDKDDWALYDPWGSREGHQQFLDLIIGKPLGVGRADKQLSEFTYEELVEERDLLDRVARVLSIELDVDYIAALERLDGYYSSAQIAGREPATLRDALDVGPISLDVLDREVKRLERTDSELEEKLKPDEAVMLDRGDDSEPGEINEMGRVMLSADTDRARLLTDPYELTRAYLQACELHDAYSGEEGRRRFEGDFRHATEAGQDLVGTLKLERQRDEQAMKRWRAEDARRLREEHERAERARKRELKRDINDADDELRKLWGTD